MLGAIQKLRNGQRGEEVDDFVRYRYVYFEGERRVILRKCYVTANRKFENYKSPI